MISYNGRFIVEGRYQRRYNIQYEDIYYFGELIDIKEIRTMKYEVSTGTYREDLLDFNIIKLINSYKDNNKNVNHFDINTVTSAKTINEIIDLIYDKIDISIPYLVHTKHIVEFYSDEIIIGIIANFDLKQLKIDAYGSPEAVKAYKKKFSDVFSTEIMPIKMRWCYSQGGGYQSADIPIEKAGNEIKNSHYPFITNGIDNFLEKYQKATQSVLLLTGDPGTGKTSFIKYYITKYHLNSIVTYDENVMMKDDFYINFLTNSDTNVLIVEDADALLSRRSNDNKIMSKFLNVSEGLVKGINKKIIFSTNLTNINQIDEALVRKGRCFDIVEFRRLTRVEANAISMDHGLPLFGVGDEFTLAEVFNRDNMSSKVRSMGF